MHLLNRLVPPMPEPVEVVDYRSAVRAMVDKVYVNSEGYREQQNRAVRRGAHPDILEFERKFVTRLYKLGVPFFAHAMVRTAEEQLAAFERGASKARPGQSPHNYGMAVDLVHCRIGWNLDRKSWDMIGHIGKEVAAQAGLDLEWGGDWRFWDPAHWQVKGWKLLTGKYPFPPADPKALRR